MIFVHFSKIKNLSFPLLLLFLSFFLSFEFRRPLLNHHFLFRAIQLETIAKTSDCASLLGNALRNRCRPRYTPAYDDYKGDYGSVAGFSFSNASEKIVMRIPLSAFEFIPDGFERARRLLAQLGCVIDRFGLLGRRSDSKGFRKKSDRVVYLINRRKGVIKKRVEETILIRYIMYKINGLK